MQFPTARPPRTHIPIKIARCGRKPEAFDVEGLASEGYLRFPVATFRVLRLII